jgi:hypothetical protein
MQASSQGTTNPKKERTQLEGTIREGSPQAMLMASEEQEFQLRMSNPSEGAGSSVGVFTVGLPRDTLR